IVNQREHSPNKPRNMTIKKGVMREERQGPSFYQLASVLLFRDSSIHVSNPVDSNYFHMQDCAWGMHFLAIQHLCQWLEDMLVLYQSLIIGELLKITRYTYGSQLGASGAPYEKEWLELGLDRLKL
ncbi:hypothetical protein ACJX0J_011324, partial [Zea mays]